MENPWLQLAENPPYILSEDIKYVDQHNYVHSFDPDYQVQAQLLPSPYSGNLHSSRVILLSLNPGFSPDDWDTQQEPQFNKAIRDNLRHIPTEYPFYQLNPSFQHTPGGYYWSQHLQELIEEVGLINVATKLCVIEWYPYHSKKFSVGSNDTPPSQCYSLHLIRERMNEAIKPIFVVVRAKSRWLKALPELSGHYVDLNSPQCGHVSRGNLDEWPDAYARICSALKEE